MSDPDPIDRREFLAGIGGSAVLLTGCGGSTVQRKPTHRGGLGGGSGGDPAGRRGSGSIRSLAEAVRGRVFQPGDPGFIDAAHVYNTRFDAVRPRAVVRPVDALDVRAAVRWALGSATRIRARSGGHSYAGYSTLSDGVVVDLRLLNTITLDHVSGIATIGPGAQLIDVYAKLAAQGATIPAGSCPSVGVAGVTLGGGMGLAGRAFGLTTDHLMGAEIVLPDGELHTVDARHDPDLLWALRGGGGGNFGITTALTFRTRPIAPSAAYAFVSFPWSQAGEALDAWLTWAPAADERLSSIFTMTGSAGAPTATIVGQYLGPAADLAALLAPMRRAGGTIATGEEDYLALQLRFAGCLGTSFAACHTVGTAPGGTLPREGFQAKSDYLGRALPASAISLLTTAIERRAQLPGRGSVVFDAYGGAINRVAPTATAFVHRTQLSGVQYLTYGGAGAWLSGVHAQMRPYVSGQAYQNYIDPTLTDWPTAYYGQNLPRLRAVARRVDPHGFLAFPQGLD